LPKCLLTREEIALVGERCRDKESSAMNRADTHLGNWRQPPNNRWAFNHVRELVPTARVRGARIPARLPRRTADLLSLAVAAPDGRTMPLEEVVRLTFTDSLMVLKHGAVLCEWYAHADALREPHVIFSISKSVTGALAGCLVADGLLDPEAKVAAYVPEIADSAHGDATVRHVLDMTVSLDFEENYLDQTGAFARYRMATGWNPSPRPADLKSFFTELKRLGRPHGQRFAYQSPNSDLLGWILERAARQPFATLLSERIWQPLAASDAEITVDRLGAPRTAGGICMRIEDLALFSEMMRNRGTARGRPVVPGAWIDDIRTAGSRQAWLDGDLVNLLPAGRYRSQWYQTGNDHDAFCAIGIHGQWIYVDPKAAMVVVKQSSQPTPVDDGLDQLTLAAFAALGQALSASGAA
jgi:CubicO group peptidase (beta-lactamase class C family)